MISSNDSSNLWLIHCSLNSKYSLLLTSNNVTLVFCNNFLITYNLIHLTWKALLFCELCFVLNAQLPSKL